jgi:predicted RNA polymerase sigma factor
LQCDGPEAGLAQIDALLEQGELANYYLAHSAREDMYRRLGRTAEARADYEKAPALTQQKPERQFRAPSANIAMKTIRGRFCSGKYGVQITRIG